MILKKKVLVFLVFIILMLFLVLKNAYGYEYPCFSGSNFNVEFNTNQVLGFQTDDTLLIEVKSGFLNGTSCNIKAYNKKGIFSFHAQNDSTLEISSPDAEGGFDITISGANQTVSLGNFTYQAIVKTTNLVTIAWGWRIESWIDKYTVLGMGLGGLVLMVFSPTWCALMIKKRGLDADSVERFGYAMLLFLVGFGLLIIWLWS